MKELITARYDPRLDRIEGCQYGTKAWHHEDRHRQQYNNEKLQFYIHLIGLLSVFAQGLVVGGLLLYIAISNMLGNYVLILGAVGLVPDTLLNIYLEYDAVSYSKRQRCI